MKKFIFGVITYNHEKYVVEHLESIKYLIETHGRNRGFKLVLADDGSKDRTVDYVNAWLKHNEGLFKEVVILADGINRGTCINYTNIWEHIDSPLFKITAGDDVYSFENIFEEAETLGPFQYKSGFPVLLIDGEIIKSKSLSFHTVATDVLFSKRSFGDRLTDISVMNTPNLLYPKTFVEDKSVFEFVRKFKVTEDYPMMIKIAENYSDVTFTQLSKVFVYYRRTSGSTYLIKNVDFNIDKIELFKYLIKSEKNQFKSLLLRNRLWCYKSQNRLIKVLMNTNYYVYVLRIIMNIISIAKRKHEMVIKNDLHKLHYNKIFNLSKSFLSLK